MKHSSLLFIALVAINFQTFAQTFTLYGDKCFGGNSGEESSSIYLLPGGSFLICGESWSPISGNKTTALCPAIGIPKDFWMLKVDNYLTIKWDKTIGGDKFEQQISFCKELQSGNLLFVGSSASDSSCDKSENDKGLSQTADSWMILTDSLGNKFFDKTIGASDDDRNSNLIESTQGDYYLVSSSLSSSVGGDKTATPIQDYDFWLTKFDSVFTKKWDKIYGGLGYETSDQGSTIPVNMIQEENGDVLLAGITSSPVGYDISGTPRGYSDIWLIKLDSSGNKIWDKRYGGSGAENFGKIIHTKDHGYIIAASTNSPQSGDISDTSHGGIYDCWIVKLDSLGNKQWDKRYGGDGSDNSTWISEAPDSGYWISAKTTSDSSSDVSEPRFGNLDIWVFKIDNNGNKIWDKRFGGPSGSTSYPTNFIIMPDTSIFLCGIADSGTSTVKSDVGYGGRDYWVIHFKYGTTTVGINEQATFNAGISLFPNPTRDLITIKSTTEKIKQVDLLNLVGETLQTQKVNFSNSTQVNLQTYAPGFYFVKITGEKYTVVNRVVRE